MYHSLERQKQEKNKDAGFFGSHFLSSVEGRLMTIIQLDMAQKVNSSKTAGVMVTEINYWPLSTAYMPSTLHYIFMCYLS